MTQNIMIPSEVQKVGLMDFMPGTLFTLTCRLANAHDPRYKLTASAELGAQIKACFATLAGYQQPDGYMGPFPSGFEFKQGAPNCNTPWDAVSDESCVLYDGTCRR